MIQLNDSRNMLSRIWLVSKSALLQIVSWYWTDAKALPETMVALLDEYVIRPIWVNVCHVAKYVQRYNNPGCEGTELNIIWFLSSRLLTRLCVYVYVLYYYRKQPDMVWDLTLVIYLCRPRCGQFMIVLKTLDITMTSQWAWWRLRSPVSRLFTQPFIRAQIKENFKVPRHRPLCGEFTGTGEFPAQKASNAENVSIWWRHHEYSPVYITD